MVKSKYRYTCRKCRKLSYFKSVQRLTTLNPTKPYYVRYVIGNCGLCGTTAWFKEENK